MEVRGMSTEEIVDIFRDGILLAIRVGGPILLLCMIVGVLMAIFQAVTQIHEQSLQFILKVSVVLAYLALAGTWMLRSIQEYAITLFQYLT